MHCMQFMPFCKVIMKLILLESTLKGKAVCRRVCGNPSAQACLGKDQQTVLF